MKEVPLTLVASKKSYIDRASKEIREFWIYEIILQNGIRIAVTPRDRIGYQLF